MLATNKCFAKKYVRETFRETFRGSFRPACACDGGQEVEDVEPQPLPEAHRDPILLELLQLLLVRRRIDPKKSCCAPYGRPLRGSAGRSTRVAGARLPTPVRHHFDSVRSNFDTSSTPVQHQFLEPRGHQFDSVRGDFDTSSASVRHQFDSVRWVLGSPPPCVFRERLLTCAAAVAAHPPFGGGEK